MALPSRVILEDHDLEDRAGRMTEKLAKLRWHWTLDESNPDRVSLREYARQVGRGKTTIATYAKAYVLSQAPGTPPFAEVLERASMGAEKESVVEAVAEARGHSFGFTRKERSTEIKRVREIARDQAEKRGTSVEEEASKVAKAIVRAEKAGKQVAEDRKERGGFRFISMEERAHKIRRELTTLVEEAREGELEGDFAEILARLSADIKALLGLLDLAITGSVDVDWDRELAKLSGGK